MNEPLYKNPFSEETVKLRRNVLLVSTVNIFIWITQGTPNSFALFGLTFTSFQDPRLGWFVLTISLYFLLHYLSISFPELAIWLKPMLEARYEKNELLKSSLFDRTDFLNIPQPNVSDDLNSVIMEAKDEAKYRVNKRLSPFYSFIYLKIALDVILPILYSIFGITVLLTLVIESYWKSFVSI